MGMTFSFCNEVAGLPCVAGLDEDPNLLVIWDGTPGSTGGTGELVEAWREEFNEPEIIDSNTILDNSSDPEPVRIHSGETRPNFIPSFGDSSTALRSVKIMLFADVKAFSGLVEEKTSEFVDAFHGGISKLLEKLSNRPVFLNTWGDSFFAVFESTDDALKLALDIRDYFNKKDWSEFLIDGEMDGISMHAGPVCENLIYFEKKKFFRSSCKPGATLNLSFCRVLFCFRNCGH